MVFMGHQKHKTVIKSMHIDIYLFYDFYGALKNHKTVIKSIYIEIIKPLSLHFFFR